MKNFGLLIRNYFFVKKLIYEVVVEPSNELSDIWTGNFKIGKKISEVKDPISNIENINTFNFIRDLKSFGTLNTRALARKIINFWIDENTNFLTKAFESKILSNRLSILCMTYSWFGKSGTPEFQSKLLKSISQQLKIQEFNLKKNKNNINKIPILKSLIIGNIFLYNDLDKINLYLTEIKKNCSKLIIRDGGHIYRSQQKHFLLLRDLIEIRAATATIKGVNTEFLHKIVNSMSSFFWIFCMPDNNFASFNGGSLIKKEDLIQTKKRTKNNSKNFALASNSGYARINHKNLNLLIDVGNKTLLNSNLGKFNKASIGAIELYFKKSKFITNVGESPNISKYHSNAFSSTAAHSTLSIDDRNNFDLSGRGQLNLFKVKKNQNNLGSLIEITHDGYKYNFGVLHRRTIFISRNGNDLRGEDQVIDLENVGIIPRIAFIRFHLDPFIDIIKLQSGKILLKNNDGLTSYFVSSFNDIKIEDTIIFNEQNYTKSKQIVIEFPISKLKEYKTLKCNWSFKF